IKQLNVDKRSSKRKKNKGKLESDIEIELTEIDGKEDEIEDILEEKPITKKKCFLLKIILNGLANTLSSSWLNIFLCCIPFSVIFPIFKWNQAITFLFAVLSLVSLTSLMVF